jgi:ABC-2 type transport system permease protein
MAADALTTDPVLLGVFFLSLIGAWAITYFAMVIVGTMAFWVEKSIALFDLYLGVSAVLSGYLIPLALMPSWVQTATDWLPFRYQLAFPVETLIGSHDRASALRELGVQWLFVGLLILLALAAWRRGVRRYEAYGA